MNVVQKRIVKLGLELDTIKTGYDQSARGRWSVFNFILMVLVRLKAVDCSAAYAGLCKLAGIPINIKGTCYSGNIAQLAKATGMISVERYHSLSQAKPGGALVAPGSHVVTVLNNGLCLSPEVNELGKTLGGKPGDQTGKEVKIRRLYERSGGWKWVLNIISHTTHLRRAIVAFAKGESYSVHLDRMTIVAPHDGPVARAFMKTWSLINNGMAFNYTPSEVIGPRKLAIVVLGTKLNSDGTLTKKYIERLKMTLAMAQANPNAIVIVSGGKPYNGVTEAAAGAAWLIKNGLKNKLGLEESSSSTAGNAIKTVPLMIKHDISHYVLVSHASHLRRASVDFLAAILKIEMDTNQSPGLLPVTPAAVNDYGDNPIKSERPIDAKSRETMAAEVLSILDL